MPQRRRFCWKGCPSSACRRTDSDAAGGARFRGLREQAPLRSTSGGSHDIAAMTAPAITIVYYWPGRVQAWFPWTAHNTSARFAGVDVHVGSTGAGAEKRSSVPRRRMAAKTPATSTSGCQTWAGSPNTLRIDLIFISKTLKSPIARAIWGERHIKSMCVGGPQH
jgi:hypothetical protein